MSNCVYILRETEQLDSGETAVFLEAYATEHLAQETLKKQIQTKIEDSAEAVELVDSGDDFAELVDEEGNRWTFSIEALIVQT